jgi:hypothetical protein
MTLVNGYFLTFKKLVLPFDRDSSVGMRPAIAWTVRGSNPDGVEIVHTCPDRTPTQWVRDLFPGGKAARAWR